MSNQKPLIIWDEVALTELEEIGEYFEKEVQSIQSAKKVVKTIKDTISTLPDNPEIFAIDPFIKDKSLQIRFFEKNLLLTASFALTIIIHSLDAVNSGVS